MVGLKSIFRNITLLNAGLLICSILGAHYFLSPLFKFQVLNVLPYAKKHVPDNYKVTSFESNPASPADYAIVTEGNLFHPERKIPPEKKEEAAPLPKPDLVLYGTLVTDDVSLAYLEDLKDPRNTAGRGKRQIALKKGDMLSGFILKEIDTDKIVMVRADERLTVSVHDSHRRNIKAPVATQTPGSHPPSSAQTPGPHPSSSVQTPGAQPPSSALEQLRSRYRQSKQQEKIETLILPPRSAEERAVTDSIERSRRSQ